ncbi:hypothetical protein Trydic_g12649 [Trypoxylus dichotomus]
MGDTAMQINPVLWSEPLAPDPTHLKESNNANEGEDSSPEEATTFEILEPNHSFLYSTISTRNLQVSFLNLSLPTTTEEEEGEEEVIVQLDGESNVVNSCAESTEEEKPIPKKTTPCKRISYKIKRSSSAYRKTNRNLIRGTTVAELASKFDKLCTEKRFILDDPKFAQIIKRVNSQNYSQGDAGKINRKTSVKMNIEDRISRKPSFRQHDDSPEDVEHVSVRAAIKIFECRQQNDMQNSQIKSKLQEKRISKSVEVIPSITISHADDVHDNTTDKIIDKSDDFEVPVIIVNIPVEKTIRSESAYEISHVKSKNKRLQLDFNSTIKSKGSQSVSPSQVIQEERLYDFVSPVIERPVVEKKVQPPVPPKPKNIENRRVDKNRTQEHVIQLVEPAESTETIPKLFDPVVDVHVHQIRVHDQEKAYEELLIPPCEATHNYEDIEQRSDDGYEAIIPLNILEQNIYETLPSICDSPPPLPRRQEELLPPKLPSKHTYYKVHNHDETNSYEIIDTGDILRTNIVSEASSESSYDTLLQLKWNSSGSNRGSLISCDQQSNSLYGRSIPGWTEDYKADDDSFSDRSEDWSDVDDNEGGHYPETTIVQKKNNTARYSHKISDTRSGNFSGKKKDSSFKPIPPPRSLPTTFRKPRKNIGDVVLISSTSKVYLEFRDDNYNYACLRRQNVPLTDEAVEKKCELIYVNVLDSRTKGNISKFKNKFYVGALESQEISCYIADIDHHYESVPEGCVESHYVAESFDSDYETSENRINTPYNNVDITNAQLPDTPNNQTNVLDRLSTAGKNLKRLFSKNDLTKSLGRITKRKSRGDLDNTNNSLDRGNASSSTKLDQKIDTSTTPRSSLTSQESYSEQNSVDSAYEKHKFKNKAKSTFYLTDTIDIINNTDTVDCDRKNSLSPVIQKSKNIKSSPVRPSVPPPPLPKPVYVNEAAVIKTDTRRSTSWYVESGLFKNSDNVPNNNKRISASWYAEIGLYQSGPKSTPSTSSAENSGSGISNRNELDEVNFRNTEEYNNLRNETEYNNSMDSFSSNETKMDKSSTVLSEDMQQILQEEPLYQFYNAAIVEIEEAA